MTLLKMLREATPAQLRHIRAILAKAKRARTRKKR